MSFNRENTIWQSPNGTWNIGFHDYYETQPEDDEDFDDEWDVDYTDNFHWVSTGHPTAQAAEKAWPGANPGGSVVIAYDEESKSNCVELDDAAAQCYDAANRGNDYKLQWHQSPYYEGPVKGRNLSLMLKDLNRAKLEAKRYKVQGYANLPDPRIPLWEKRVEVVKERNKSNELAIIAAAEKTYGEKLEAMADDMAKKRREERRYSYGFNSFNSRSNNRNSEAMEKELREEAEAIKRAAEKQNTSTKNTAADEKSSSNNASRYHISPTTGRPNKCTATKKPCPFGGAEAHYPDKATARAAYEKSQGSSF